MDLKIDRKNDRNILELEKELNRFIEKYKAFGKNGNWSSERDGKSGVFLEYLIKFEDNLKIEDLVGSTQQIIIRYYPNPRDKGMFSVITDKEYNFKSTEEINYQILKFYSKIMKINLDHLEMFIKPENLFSFYER